MRRGGGVRRRAGVAAAWVAAGGLLLSACAGGRPVARPSPDPERLVYSVGELSFEAPASWSAAGNERRVRLSAPDGAATLEARVAPAPGTDESCLADAESSLRKGEAALSRVQRHASTFAGRRAVAQEADDGGWHGWAWATCAAGDQYRVWFSARAPVDRERLEVRRRLVATARLGNATRTGEAARGAGAEQAGGTGRTAGAAGPARGAR